MLEKLIRHISFRNFIATIAVHGLNVGVALIATPIIFSAVGAPQYGYINLALSVVGILSVVIHHGYHLSAPRDIALTSGNTSGLSSLVGVVMINKLVLTVIVVSVLMITFEVTDWFEGYRTIMLWSLVLIFSEMLFPQWIMQGLEKMKIVTIITILSKSGYLVLLFLLIRGVEDARWVNFLMGACALVFNFLSWIYIYRKYNLSFSYPGWRQLWISYYQNFSFFLSSVASQISIHSGLIILSNFVSAYSLGIYSLSNKVAMVARIIPSVVIQVTLPRVSRYFQEERDRFIRFTRLTFLITLLTTGAVSILLYFGAYWIIYFLAQSPNEDAVRIMKILAFVPFTSSLNVGNMLILLATNQRKLLLYGTWIMLVIMLTLSFYASIFFGVIGYAYAMLVVEILYFMVQSVINFTKIPSVTKQFYFE